MNAFWMNGYLWHIQYVPPKSPVLYDRTGEQRVATTDPNTRCVYVSNQLSGDFLRRVLTHELSHCAMISFDLIGDLNGYLSSQDEIGMEEWICNFVADYGRSIFRIVDEHL